MTKSKKSKPKVEVEASPLKKVSKGKVEKKGKKAKDPNAPKRAL